MTRFKTLLELDIVPMENEPLAVIAAALSPDELCSELCFPEQDSVGDWFIGYGTSIQHGIKIHAGSDGITLEHAMDCARAELYEALEQAPRLVEPEAWHLLNEVQRDVLALMVYQMGFAGVYGFNDMRFVLNSATPMDRLNGGIAIAAHDAMLDSRWARNQTPRRALCMAERMRDGVWKSVEEYR